MSARLSLQAGDSGQDDGSSWNGQEGKGRLRRQSWRASFLILCTWLLSVILCFPVFLEKPVTILTVPVGLAVGIHILVTLFRHLNVNHRPGQADRLLPTLGAANWITLLRATAVVALAGFMPAAASGFAGLPGGLALMPGLIYLAISLADLLDGLAARLQDRVTELGRKLDIETDAAGLAVASLLAVILEQLPAVYLLAGFAYYLFVLGIWIRRRRGVPVVELRQRPYARIVAGFQMGLVAMALLPIFNPIYTRLAGMVIMTPLLLGFLRDWLVVSCTLGTGADQRSILEQWAENGVVKLLPLLLRLAVISGGAGLFFSDVIVGAGLFWQLAPGLCVLLAGGGLMGRSASLFLVLLLGCSLSPFGMTWPALVTFSAAVALMLTGSGRLSVWAPEERILYRSNPRGTMMKGKHP